MKLVKKLMSSPEAWIQRPLLRDEACRWIKIGHEGFGGKKRRKHEFHSSVSITHRQTKERSEIALCSVCPLCLYLFISSLLSGNIWASLQHWPCVRACTVGLHVVTHHFLQDFVTIFQLTCRSGAWSLVPSFQDDKVYLSVFWHARRKLGLTAREGRKRGATTSSPPHNTKCHPSPGCSIRPAILLKRADI